MTRHVVAGRHPEPTGEHVDPEPTPWVVETRPRTVTADVPGRVV